MPNEIVHGIVDQVGGNIVEGVDTIELVSRRTHHERVACARAVLRHRQSAECVTCVVDIAGPVNRTMDDTIQCLLYTKKNIRDYEIQ